MGAGEEINSPALFCLVGKLSPGFKVRPLKSRDYSNEEFQ